MNRMESDPFLISELETARAEIPSFFRLSPRKMKVIRTSFIVIGFVELLVICLFPRWHDATIREVKDLYGKTQGYSAFPTGYIRAILIVAACAALLAIYLFLCHLWEKQAFKEASRRALITREKYGNEYLDRVIDRKTKIAEMKEETSPDEDPFGDEMAGNSSGIAANITQAEDPLLVQLREKKLLEETSAASDPKTEEPKTETANVIIERKHPLNPSKRMDRFGGDLASLVSPKKAIDGQEQENGSTSDEPGSKPEGAKAETAKVETKRKYPLNPSKRQDRFGGDLATLVSPQKPIVVPDQDTVTASNDPDQPFESKITYAPPIDLPGVLRSSTESGVLDEVELFEPDEGIEIFKKK